MESVDIHYFQDILKYAALKPGDVYHVHEKSPYELLLLVVFSVPLAVSQKAPRSWGVMCLLTISEIQAMEEAHLSILHGEMF